MLPVVTGVIPFGAVMGTAAHEAGLSVWQSTWMNVLVFAGASQLAAVDLMTKNVSLLVVVATGLVINLRFVLYSAAFSPFAREASWGTKLLSAYMLTDQSYAVMSANEAHFRSKQDALTFYFGNFSPRDWALDYAVPSSFVVLVIPTLKTWKHRAVAVCSGVFGILFRDLPLNVGLLVAAFCAMAVALLLMRLGGLTKSVRGAR